MVDTPHQLPVWRWQAVSSQRRIASKHLRERALDPLPDGAGVRGERGHLILWFDDAGESHVGVARVTLGIAGRWAVRMITFIDRQN